MRNKQILKHASVNLHASRKMAVITPTSNCDVNLDRLKLTSESIKRRVEESTFFRCRPKALNAIDYTESSSFDCLRAKRPYNNVIWPWPFRKSNKRRGFTNPGVLSRVSKITCKSFFARNLAKLQLRCKF